MEDTRDESLGWRFSPLDLRDIFEYIDFRESIDDDLEIPDNADLADLADLRESMLSDRSDLVGVGSREAHFLTLELLRPLDLLSFFDTLSFLGTLWDLLKLSS